MFWMVKEQCWKLSFNNYINCYAVFKEFIFMYAYLVNHNIRVTSFKYILCCSMINLFADYYTSVLLRVTTITITQL